MSVFLLAVAAIVGTLMVILNPIRRVAIQFDGKPLSAIEAAANDYTEKTPKGQQLSDVTKWGCFIFLALVFNWIIEPVFVLSALSGQIGNQTIAYGVLAVVGTKWMSSIYSIFFKKKKTEKAQAGLMTVVTADGRPVEGTLVGVDEEIRLGNPIVRNAKIAFFALPTLYLWYLFAVSIHVVAA
jgi:hypothetical protein